MQNLTEYNAFLSTLRERTGLESFLADQDGLVSFRVDDKYNINLQFIKRRRKTPPFRAGI